MSEELTARPPEQSDLVTLCRNLNALEARHVVIGGFAMIQAGFPRTTIDIDLLIDTTPQNEANVFEALKHLPDQAVNELKPGDVEQYTVVRVADEIVIDLMQSAGGVDYEQAKDHIVVRDVAGVQIPFASPSLRWRMKAPTHREKDQPDVLFLRKYFEANGEVPPSLT